MKKALILLAGGSGKRFSNPKKRIPKQFIKFDSYNLIEYFLHNLESKIFDRINIVTKHTSQKNYLSKLINDFPKHNIQFVKSGRTRQESSKKGIYSLIKYNPSKVLIHDTARPLASNKLIKRLLKSLKQNKSCAPYIISNDFTKNTLTNKEVDNKKIIHIQTPQAFIFKSIVKAHNNAKKNDYKDDTSLMENIGIKTKFIKGEKSNI